MWTLDAIAALERAEATRRGATREELARVAVERHRRAMEAEGYVVGGDPVVEPVTQGAGCD